MEVCKKELKADLFWSRCVDYVSNSFRKLENDKNKLIMIFLCFYHVYDRTFNPQFSLSYKNIFYLRCTYFTIHEHTIRELFIIELGYESRNQMKTKLHLWSCPITTWQVEKNGKPNIMSTRDGHAMVRKAGLCQVSPQGREGAFPLG